MSGTQPREQGPAVILVGPMGVGKSTVGALLAERLGLPSRDTDEDVVARAGKPISELFLDEGEDHFRALEREAVAEALADHKGVLALGGGAILDPDTRRLLAGRPVFYLEMGVAEAVKRVGLDAPRPLLMINPRRQWRALMDERRPLYVEVARAVVSAEERTPAEVADEILGLLDTTDESEGLPTPRSME